jgi:hypothetical protein
MILAGQCCTHGENKWLGPIVFRSEKVVPIDNLGELTVNWRLLLKWVFENFFVKI